MIFLFPFSERTHSILKEAVRAPKMTAAHFEMGTQMSSANWDQRQSYDGAGQRTRDGVFRCAADAHVCVPVPALAGMPETAKMGL